MATEGGGDDYVYLPLVDAMKAVGQKVNLFAFITEIGVPRRSRGTDYVLTLKIADQSYQALGLSVNFFSEHAENLPHAKCSGDIICLRCVMIRIYEGEMYSVFNKRLSSFAIFDGKAGADFVPYQTSAKFHGLLQDGKFIRELRTWLLNHQSDTGADDYTLQLSEIRTDKVFDLVCKVLHVCQTSEVEWVIFAWDGTDTPPVGLQTVLDVEGENPCPLHVEAFSLKREVVQAFPYVGTILRIFSKEFFKEITQLQDDCCWVRFRNIACQLHYGIWKGMLHSSSKIRFLSHDDDIILSRQRSYSARISAEGKLEHLCRPLTRYPQPSNVTETDYGKVVNATLMESVSHTEPMHKFKCVVRVVAACPWKVEDLWSFRQGRYRVRLTLEDPTTRIHSYIHGEDGVKFFGGYPPGDKLAVMMNKLLGISETSTSDGTLRNPPWVSICLKSYYLDKNDPWGSRRYQVFGTRLVG